jgi:hypothetical protein
VVVVSVVPVVSLVSVVPTVLEGESSPDSTAANTTAAKRPTRRTASVSVISLRMAPRIRHGRPAEAKPGVSGRASFG